MYSERNHLKEEAQGYISKAANIVKKGGIWSFGILAGFVLINASMHYVDSGETVRFQNNFTGKYEWIQKEGYQFNIPFTYEVETYNSVSTIAVTDDSKLLESASATRGPLSVTFLDNYGGNLEAGFRAKLSTSDEQLESMHQDIKSQKNLEGNTLLPFAKDMLNLTTDQFAAQDFMQGGKGAFKQRLQDQSDNGMLVTKREKVEVEDETADQTKGEDRSQASTSKQFQYKVIIQTDNDGKPLRRPHSLVKYGIQITQIDLGEFAPAPDLVDYITTIKKREKARADAIAAQRFKRQENINVQLDGERERILAKNKAIRDKEQAEIEATKKVSLAELQADKETVEKQKEADLAIIDKKKELQIATDNEGIQKANYAAAKYEAQAVKEMGLAQAAVTKAKYLAIDKVVFAKEVERDLGLAKYRALPQMKVEMPHNVFQSGSNGTDTSLQDLTNLHIIEKVK